MLRSRDRRIVVIAILIFLVTQSLIFASIPRGGTHQAATFIVKNGTGLVAIAERLKDEGFINSTYLFLACSLLYRGKLMAGEYAFTRDMSILDILGKMARGDRNIYTLRILEGHNLFNVADTMARAQVMKADDFLALAREKTVLANLGIAADSLEGYLAPDTYYYSKEFEVDKLLERIAQRTLKIFAAEDVRKRMAELNLDVHKVLTLASMIEKEAKMKEEKSLISAVFHNRLKKGMSLDCDPTVIYGTRMFDSPIRKSDLTTYTPYNTYTFRGLPKGPICNPDKASIMAALYPAAVDHLFFVSRNDGTHVFSRDMGEHNRSVALYQRAKSKKNHK